MIPLHVTLWGKSVGAVIWHQDQAYFEFEPEFIRLGQNIAPITMPLSSGKGKVYSFPGLNKNSFRGLCGLLAESLPGAYGMRVLNLCNPIRGISNSVEALRIIHKNGKGALEYGSGGEEMEYLNGVVDPCILVEVVRNMVNNPEVINSYQRKILFQISYAVSGGSPEASIRFCPKTKAILFDNDLNTVGRPAILKMNCHNHVHPGINYGLLEYAYFLMARAAQIKIMDCHLAVIKETPYFVSERFDREGVNKLLIQSISNICHIDSENHKHSYESVFSLINRISDSKYEDSQEMFRRMVFNVMTRNQNDHVGNIYFTMWNNGKWRLSPAINITYANDIWHKQHQLSVNGKKMNKFIKLTDIEAIGERLNIVRYKTIINEVKEAVLSWKEYASIASLPNSYIEKVESQFNKLVD